MQLTNKTRELVNHYKLVHPNIVGFRQAFLTRTHLVLVMELMAKATLIDFVVKQQGGVATEAQARCATAQILAAIAHAHANNIVHRDLKLCNTLLTELPTPGAMPLVKVCDLGYSRALSVGTGGPGTFVGTSYYIPPEVYRSKTSGERYAGEPMDIYSVGVCILIMLRGDYPYTAKKADAALGGNDDPALKFGEDLARADALVPLLVEEAKQLHAAGRCSADCLRVMKWCFEISPDKRPTAQALLNDPWITAGAPYPQPVR